MAKNHLYVGGLAEEVSEGLLRAAFIPFGEIKDVSIPVQRDEHKHRGFGFVTFEEADDAADAVDNMHDAELYGRVLNVTVAKPQTVLDQSKAVWNAEEWMDKSLPVSVASVPFLEPYVGWGSAVGLRWRSFQRARL